MHKLSWAVYVPVLRFGACLPGVETGGLITIISTEASLTAVCGSFSFSQLKYQ